MNGYKTLFPNDYNRIIEEIINIMYMKDTRLLCSHCPRKFISYQSLKSHINCFQKIGLKG